MKNRISRRVKATVVMVGAAAMMMGLFSRSAGAQASTGTALKPGPYGLLNLTRSVNPPRSPNLIQIENRRRGDTSWQITNPAKNHEIEGYGSATSVNVGDSINFFVNTTDPSFTLDVYRMGWYDGDGARHLWSDSWAGVQQPTPSPDPSTGLIECQWTNPYTLQIPSHGHHDHGDWQSGVYLVKLTGNNSGLQSYIVFVVRDDERSSDLLFQHAVTTDEAYNAWGGLSLYSHPKPAYKVSFNRPFDSAYGAANFFRWEYSMIRFLEREGYDVTYSTNVDTHESGDQLLNHRALLSVGHDEYWSWEMRDNVESARDQGLNLGFFSADDSNWQIRFESSQITGDADRTIVCYRVAKLDPFYNDGNQDDQNRVTVRFWQPPVNRPEDAMVGIRHSQDIGSAVEDIVIWDSSSWIFDNTGLTNGSHLTGLLGTEADRLFSTAPPGIALVAHSPYVLGNVKRYADMTVYSASSGATVFAAGSFRWSWGLDDFSFDPVHPVFTNSAAQQVTRNILDQFLGF